MTANPLVTVLMPVYNAGKYLKLSMESVLAQSYRDFEFLIINDCSTDNSMDIIRSFEDSRLTVYSNATNIGQTKSLNVGLNLAKGKYIIVNDSDDLSLPKRIEKQLSFIINNPQYIVVGTSAMIIGRGGDMQRTFLKPIDPREITFWILSDTPIIHGSVIMQRDAVLAQGGYNEGFKLCQDYELWSSLIRKGFQVANIPDILVKIRHYSESISFKEKDLQTIENGKILYSNITSLTSLVISMNDAIKQRMFYAFPENLAKEEFDKAEDLFIKKYHHLINLPFKIDDITRSYFLKKILMKPYSKRALGELKKGRFKEARKITRHFLKNYGSSSLPLFMLLTSYSNKRFLEKILHFFNKWQSFSANLYYLRRSKMDR